MELKGARIVLREFASGDVDALHAVHSDPNVLRYYAFDVGTREHAQALVDTFIAWAGECPRQNFQLAIVDSDTNRLLGSCGIRTKGCPPGEADFGIGIASEWWGKGIAQEAARLVLSFGFFELAVQSVRGVAVAENEGVSTFAARLGFTSAPPRRGDSWMTDRGWSARDWSLSRDNWEIPLSGGRTTPSVVRVGDTVRRPVAQHGAFAHALLNHLETHGFDGAPRFLGIDGAGRETLSFISGSVPPELGAFSEDQTAAAARLLRQLHDATLDSPLRNGHEVLCHGDASPCNCVFVEGTPVAFIDFDNAHPGSRLDDLGYASWLWLDIGNADVSAHLQGSRIADFFRSYGMDAGLAIDSIVAAQRALSARTDSTGVREWANSCRAWVERHRDGLAAAILEWRP
jgi:RimJ/RimL family protein N-acetyltransferase